MVATNGWFTVFVELERDSTINSISSLSPTVENEPRIYLFIWLGLVWAYFFSCGGLYVIYVHDFANCTRLSPPLSLSVGGVAVKERTTTTWCNNTPDIELALQHELLCCCCRISQTISFFSPFRRHNLHHQLDKRLEGATNGSISVP